MMMWVLAANFYRVEYDIDEHEAVILAVAAGEMGFLHAAIGPMVRSSYHADRQAKAAGVPAAPTS